MKIKTFSVILALVLLLSSFSISASAIGFSDTEYASMDISYQIDFGYTVHIPDSANMSNGRTFEITASNVILPSEQVLCVSLDQVMSGLIDNAITLRNEESMALSCNVYREDKNGSNKAQITTDDLNFALFKSGETEAFSGGVISLSPILSNGVSPGSYSGKLYFIINTVDYPPLS